MGVIKRIENLFEIRTSLSEESLYLPSSDEEEFNYTQFLNERQSRQAPKVIRQRPAPVGPAFPNLKNHSGKKKFRRYHNGIVINYDIATGITRFLKKKNEKNHTANRISLYPRITVLPVKKFIITRDDDWQGFKKIWTRDKYLSGLQIPILLPTTSNQLITLAEEEELQEVTIEDFIVSSKSPFSVLLEDNQSLEKWDEFVSSSEEKQRDLLEACERKKIECSKQPVINRALRSLLRRKNLPIGMLQYLEQELISFFLAQPTKTYTSPALSSFERLLLHSVSNYHRLASLSFVSEPEKIKLVRVKNPRNEFTSPPLLLVQYLKSTYGVN